MSEWKLVFTPKRKSKNNIKKKGDSSNAQQSINVTNDEVINAQEGSADSNMNGKTKTLKHEQVSLKLGRLIKKGRQIKKITQKDLATKTLLKLKVIRDYEANRGIFNKEDIEKIEEVLGMQLIAENGDGYCLPNEILKKKK